MSNVVIAFRQLRKLLTSSSTIIPRARSGGLSSSRPLFRGICSTHCCRQIQDGVDPGKIDQKINGVEHSFEAQTSKEEAKEQEYEHEIKQKILKASMPHVHEFGWTQKALEAGAQSEGLPPIAHGMFPRGGAELVFYFYAQCNTELGYILAQRVEQAKQEGLEKPKIKPFIRDAIETRLRMVTPYLDVWTQAMAIQTLPQNAPESWSNLQNLADEIWYHAGDRSVDFNWYTKRLTLAGVYKTSEIYMLQDESEDLQNTLEFVDRRLDDLQTFGSSKRTLEQTSDVLKESLLGFCIMGRNMLGMNSRKR